MTSPQSGDEPPPIAPQPPAPPPVQEPSRPQVDRVGRRGRGSALVAAGLVVLAIAVIATAGTLGRGTPGASAALATPNAAGVASGSPAAPGVASGSPAAPASPGPSGAPASAAPAATPAGRLAVVDAERRLRVVDAAGGSAVPLEVAGVAFGEPAWSPDGMRIAVIGSGSDAAAVYVFQVPAAGATGSATSTVIYRSADQAPFYLSWSPDGEQVAFLATEEDGISLRTAPADGRPAVDGPQGDGTIREGAPFYFAWEDAGRLLVHVGTGADAYGGDLTLDGAAIGRPLEATGDFRGAGLSRDGRWVASVGGDPGSATLVVQARDGSDRTAFPVFGPAALAFDPVGSAVAWIAADRPTDDPAAFPFGPLRLHDPETAEARTILDSAVAGFFWSPDGRTIAAIHLAPDLGPTARRGAILARATGPGPVTAASPAPALVLHLAFVDVAGGTVLSDRTIRLGEDFIRTVLPYFDQYALSHHVWSPDGASIVLPLIDDTGRTRATVLDADGSPGRPIADAVSAFWAP